MLNKKMSLAVRSALGLATVASAMSAGLAFGQDADGQEVDVEAVLVTVPRIQRTTNTESQYVVSITAADMKLTGKVSVADALRSSTLNSVGSFHESSGNSAQSNGTFNLRGAGASRTAVLINGRRTVGSPSLGGGGSVQIS
jgi:iron complex outermembrane receptor protein